MLHEPKKRMRRSDRRQQIVEQAIAVFGERGYRAATTAELAKAAAISEALLYQHFASKKALLIAAIHHLGEQINAGLQQILAASKDPSLTLVQLFAAFTRFLQEKPEVMRFSLALVAELDEPETIAAVRDVVWAAVQLLTRALKNGQKSGALRSDMPAEMLAWLVISVYQTYGLLQRLDMTKDIDEKALRKLAVPFLGTVGRA